MSYNPYSFGHAYCWSPLVWIIMPCMTHQFPALPDGLSVLNTLVNADLPAVGQILQVYWPLDRAWYSGRVLSYTEAQGSTQVVYDDGDVEMLHMVMERYRVSPGMLCCPVT